MTLDIEAPSTPVELGRCTECGTETAPPPEWCPACWSDHVETVLTEGPGRVAAATVVHRGPRDVPLPFGLAYVDVTDRLRLMMRFDANDTGMVPGVDVRVSAQATDGPVPVYTAERVNA